jgi:PAS domain S-box-containing protein
VFKRSTAILFGLAILLVPAFSLMQWTSEALRPYAEVIQWLIVAGLLLVAREVMNRLNKSESKLRALLQSLDEIIVILDKDGRYVEVAETNRPLLYKPNQQVPGRRVHDIFPKDYADVCVATIQRALASDQSISIDYSLPFDDREIWINASVTRLSESTVLWVGRDITQRKNAEMELERRVAERTRELRLSEERYRSVIDQAEEIISMITPEGIIVSLNPAFERVLGWEREHWIGRSFFGLVPADLQPVAEHLFMQLDDDGKIGPVRVTAVHKNGSRVAIEVTARQKFDSGIAVGFQAVMRDVTEREIAQSALRDRERQLAEAQTVAKLGSWEFDLVGGTMWWSDEAYRLFGLEPRRGPTRYEEFLERIQPHERQLVADFRSALLLNGEHSAEVELETRSGERRVFLCHGKLARDGHGAASRVIGAFQDVTDRRRAEEKLRQSEERFRLATMAASEAIWDFDLATGRSWHSEGYRIFGYGEGLVENGLHWWKERLHPDDVERITAIREEAWQTGEASWSGEYRFRKADGSYAQVLHRALIVRDSNKKAVRVVGALLDMTERKQLVDQLEQAKRVSSLGRVAASIAHEFNNILMGIQPNVEAIQRSSPTGLRTMTENINRAVQRGKRVTDEILRFTRPSEPALECVAVPEFFASWRAEVEPFLSAAVETIIDIPEEALYVSADPMQLAQIFTNLALNARDAMQDHGGRLTISAHLSNSFGSFPFGVVKTPDRFVHFTVQDEGCGISSDRLTHIFEPLFTTKRGGIGLGLAITYQIVTRHGGHIFVESEVGRGSTFHLFLPAALPEIHESVPKVESSFSSIRRLVLVEDEPAVASGIAMLLEMEGVSVVTVHTGQDSIPAIEEFGPDAVILDIGLPDMDGVGVYLEIHRRWPDLAVLFSSGHGDSSKLESYLARPNVGFILKPYEFDAMRAALCRLVEDRPAEQAC